jgi:hypothetical protein
MFGLLFGMCRFDHAIERKLHEEGKARRKLEKDVKEVKKALYPNKTPPGSEERESNTPPFRLSKDMQVMKTLILIILLPPMQAPLIWRLTLSLVETLDSMVTPLMHLL